MSESEQLKIAMQKYQREFIALIRECAVSSEYRNLTGREALQKVADRLEGNKK